jgi:hypothetical protein
MTKLSSQDIEKQIQVWTAVTLLSLEHKRTTLKKRCPDLNDRELAQRV